LPIWSRYRIPPAAAGGPIIEFCNASKIYSRRRRAFLRDKLAQKRSASQRFYALKNVSFSVPRGESLGVLGANGAGKTTLLMLVAGISSPDEGQVLVRGSVAPLLELAAGFHHDLTGRENVLLNAALLGLSRKTALARFDEIVEFSGVGNFIEEPLRTYSTGMRMRLAFSVAVSVEPEILLIDEAFAVGDQEFQAKCVDRIARFRKAGRTLLCVSHNPELLRQFCDHGIWLEHGELVCAGSVSEVIEAYQAVTPGRHVRGIAN
jgi:ABC-type polysaccharide/polyol phosphate transport system ATPase subunit